MMRSVVDKYAERRAAVARMGIAGLDDVEVQRVLSFNKTGSTIYDRLGKPSFEFEFPSDIGKALFFKGSFEADLVGFENMLVTREPVPLLLDVGANIGLHVLSWCSVSPQARAYALEADERSRTHLERNVNRNGMSERVSVVPLDVNQIALDEFVRQQQIDRISLMRVDVKGDEGAFFAGASGTLDHLKPPIVVRFGSDPAASENVASILRTSGYRANALIDGYAIPVEKQNDDGRHYVFLHASQKFSLPPYPGTPAVLAATLDRLATIRQYERATATNEIDDLRRLLQERQLVIDELTQAVERLQQIAEERQSVIDELAAFAANSERDSTEATARAVQDERTVAVLSAQLVNLRALSDERLAVIESLEGALYQIPC